MTGGQDGIAGAAPPDFAALAARYPDTFGRFVKYRRGGGDEDATDNNGHQTQTAYIDFHDAEAVRALTQTVLLHDYGLHVDLPENRLCPPIPNRLNYIRWIRSVLESTRREHDGRAVVSFEPIDGHDGDDGDDDHERPAKRLKRSPDQGTPPRSLPPPPHTLDIGTGAIAIYPLLGCTTSPRWTFTATDIDEASLAHARRTIADKRNNNTAGPNLSSRIRLLKRNPQDDLIPLDATRADDPLLPLYHATMCNPPFFTSASEMHSNRLSKAQPPNAVCSGSEGEMITAGGEVAFVSRIVDESLRLQTRVTWYTSLLGKLSSLPTLLQLLKERGVSNIGATEFVQGQTRRWAVIWSFTKYRLPDHLVQIRHASVQKLLSGAATIRRNLPFAGVSDVLESVSKYVASLGGGEVQHREDALYLRFERNVWNRAARRAAAKGGGADAQRRGGASSSTDPILCLLVRVGSKEEIAPATIVPDDSATLPLHLTLTLQWTYGEKRVDFDGFASALLRHLSAAAAAAASDA